MIKRYFYKANPILVKWLQKNRLASLYEDSIYRSAFLAAIKLDSKAQYSFIRQQIMNMTMVEQAQYAQNMHIQQIFKHFSIFHTYSRGKQMIFDVKNSTKTTQLVDADKFPIWDLKKYKSSYQSLWDYHISSIRYDIGHQLIVRQSQIQHIQGGRGVFIVLPKKKQKIEIGQLLGVVPGKIYNSYQDYKSFVLNKKSQYQSVNNHLHFPSGKVLQIGQITKRQQDQTKKQMIQPTFYNPFALGHMINHPPPGKQPNVCFNQIIIDIDYYPKYLLKYLPYDSYLENKKQLILYGIFAIKQIEDQEQLFVDYGQSHIYPIEQIPQWLIEPPKNSKIFQFLVKQEYQHTQQSYWAYIQKQALKQNRQKYQRYMKQRIVSAGTRVNNENKNN